MLEERPMAEKDKETTVELEDDATIEVDLTDNPELAGAIKPQQTKEAEPSPPAGQQTAPAEVKSALEEAKRTAEELRKRDLDRIRAAEETAAKAQQTAEQWRLQAEQSKTHEKRAQEEATARELAIIDNGIESSKREISALESEIARLHEAGEFAQLASANTKLARASAALDRMEAAKADYEATVARKPAEPEPEPIQQSTQSPFEQYVSQFAPSAQNWIRQHPECAPPQVGGNAKDNAKMMAGHYQALAEGYQPNSEDYFRVIEEHTGHRKVEAPAAKEETKPADVKPVEEPKPKKVQPSAPPSREPMSATGTIPNTTRRVTLTAQQQEHARLSFPELEPAKAYAKYARNLIELEAEGKMGRQHI
jgi:chromosome segregation ATPase